MLWINTCRNTHFDLYFIACFLSHTLTLTHRCSPSRLSVCFLFSLWQWALKILKGALAHLDLILLMAAVNHTVQRKNGHITHAYTCTIKHALVHRDTHGLYALDTKTYSTPMWTQILTHTHAWTHSCMHRKCSRAGRYTNTSGFALTPRDEFQSKVFASVSKE